MYKLCTMRSLSQSHSIRQCHWNCLECYVCNQALRITSSFSWERNIWLGLSISFSSRMLIFSFFIHTYVHYTTYITVQSTYVHMLQHPACDRWSDIIQYDYEPLPMSSTGLQQCDFVCWVIKQLNCKSDRRWVHTDAVLQVESEDWSALH